MLFVALTACTPVGILNAVVPSSGVVVTTGIAYGTGPRAKLDIYSPAAAAKGYPVAVFLYGGGWRSGSRADYAFVATSLARRGFVVVVPDYRLYPEVRFPAFLADCAEAVAWTLRHAREIGGDPTEVSVIGHSAGGYNAAMLALDPAFLAAAGARRGDLAAVVGIAGPYDFLPITDPDVIPVFAGPGDPAATQPITFVDGRNPPLLLLSGDEDETVKPSNVTNLAARVRRAGGPVATRFYPGLGHIGIILSVAPAFAWRAPVLDDIVTFLAAPRARDPDFRH